MVLIKLGRLFYYFPRSEKQYLKLPKNLEDAKSLGDILFRYKDKYYFSVLGGIFALYIL